MKIKKFLPLAFVLALACPAFADSPQDSATSTMNLTLNPFVYISTAQTNITSTSTFNADYTTLTLGTALSPTFKIVTNNPLQDITVSAKVNGGADEAFYPAAAAGSGWALAFANTAADAAPTSDAVANLTGGVVPTKTEDNANVIGVGINSMTLTPNVGSAGGGYRAGESAPVAGDNSLTYHLKEGTYNLAFVLNTTNMTKTFSTHDSHGTYTTVLKLTATTGS